ncbi:acetyl-CoA synthetase-like protein, partial [Ramaria rubella]
MAGLVVQDAYIVRQAWNLPLGTRSDRLREAFEDFIGHPNGMMFRTVFAFDPTSNRWLQVLMRPGARRIEWTTIVVSDENELQLRVADYEGSRAIQSFGKGHVPARACVFELGGFARVLVFSMHHALLDHWALDNVIWDLEDVYAHRPLAPRRSFKAMIKYLERLDRTPGLDFWRRHLANAVPTPFLQALPGASRSTTNATAGRELRTGHGSFTRESGIMPSTLVTAAWSLVLAAHSNSKDVVFGQVLAGRNAPIKDVWSMTGITINTVPRRVIRRPEITVLDMLRQIQSDQIEISKHENIALGDLQSEGIVPSGLFKTILNFRNFPGGELVSPKAADGDPIFTDFRQGSRDGLDYPFALTVDVSSANSLFVSVAHIVEIIPDAEVQVLLDHFEAALLFLIQHPRSYVDDVELISAEEKQRVMPVVKPIEHLSSAENISELIEMQVRKTPQRIALQFDQETFLTYAEMDGLANSVARKLVDGGIQRGTLIALYMDKSIEMFLSILAVHKAGGGYVPLDIDHPTERIQTIIRLAQTTTVLTTREFHSRLTSTILDATVEAVSIYFGDLSPGAKPDVGRVGRDDVCHVLFTSGSTGTPKGVILTHGSIVESAIGSQEVMGPLNGRVLQFSNYTFDVSVWDWSATLIAGGTLCIARKQWLIDDLGEVSRDMDVTFIETTPTVLSLIHPEDVPSLQMLAIGGEVLTPNVRDTWADAVSFINVYGPTEASTNVLALRDVSSSTDCSNIGHSFGLNAVYHLDERLRPVPLGCVGELFIGGPQVARGYLQNPEETAKAFVPDPFRPGSTMYATGDLVRMSPVDGSLSFVDRRDTQIKIRGLRVETGEIEAVLKATRTAITNAVVIKVDVGHETLVAFLEYGSDVNTEDVTIVDDEAVGEIVASLRHAIRQKLPSYMAPTMYVALNRFPVASTGKLDRKALKTYFHLHEPTIQASIANAAGGSVDVDAALLTETQLAVRSLWASILRIREAPLRIDDDFYTMGGDSISAIRLASAAREAGLHLPATDIIRNPTIRAMAKIAESAVVDHEFDDDEAPSVTLDEMRPEDLTVLTVDEAHLDFLRVKLLPDHGLSASDVLDVYPTTGLQTSLLMAGLVVQDAYNVRQAWNLPLGTHSDRLQETFEEFIDHPNGMMFRTVFAFDPTSNRWLQVLMRPGARRMEWTTIVVCDETDLELRVAEYEGGRAIRPFEQGEVAARACVFELDGFARVLVWCMHHALFDGWAMDNVISDLHDVYDRRPLPLRRSFKPMIKYLERLNRTAGVDFWRSHLEDVSPTPFLQSPPGALRVKADATVTRTIQTGHESFIQVAGIMPSTLVTGAWSIVLAAHANCSDVVFGQVLAGRSAPIRGIESLTGVTLNTVARRVILRPETTVLDTLRQIQSEQVALSKHENITAADLDYAGLSVASLFKSILNFRNAGTATLPPASSTENRLLAEYRDGSTAGLDYPFTLSVVLSSGDFSLDVVYASDIIPAAEVNVILDHFETALEFMIHHPTALMRDVELINANELQRLIPIVTTEKQLNPANNISELIEMQVQKTPQRIALQFDQETFLTYADMDGLANDLARKLADCGIHRGTLVALYMDKSIEMFLAILAVHKAGGGYVPLDIDHPTERIQTIIRLAQTTMVLTTTELHSRLATTIFDTTATAVPIDFRDLSPSAKPDIGHVGRNDVSHVLFTSGSTGTPKGVILTHGSIIESIIGSQEVLGHLNARVLQFSNYTFDFSVWDWGATLIAGGTLCIVPKQTLIDDLGVVSRNMDVTFIETTPTVLSLIRPENVPSILIAVMGGEVVTPEVRDAWADAVSLKNVYGPTETATAVTAVKDVTPSTQCATIGRRFGLNYLYLLDESLRPVPLGCLGELFVGGPQVARGYLGMAEETAKAFVADPFRVGSTMYATGDLVRMNPVDGSLSFVDRRDTQIKIRGLRVETGEIEAVLKATRTAITNAVVIKVDVGHETLVAFLEYSSDESTEDVEMVHDEAFGEIVALLRHAIRQKLPSYMAPTIYAILNRFPVTTSGKLDRKALKTYFHLHQQTIMATFASASSGGLVDRGIDAALLTEMQLTVRSLWASILRISEAPLRLDD